MPTYEQKIRKELADWKKKLLKNSGIASKLAKKTQNKINSAIPERVHHVITEAIKKVVQATLVGSEFMTKSKPLYYATLQQRDEAVRSSLNKYKKVAAAEGAGTGAGGLLLGVADFPLLLSIKMKFLFETAALYGYDVSHDEERLFILQIFQLAFSSQKVRRKTLSTIEHWDNSDIQEKAIDWRILQQEYRDHIDLVKLLQLMPGIGAVVGALANYSLLDHLGETAMNAYRIRIIGD